MNNKDFYIDEVDISAWLNNDEYQVIRFKDRIEFRFNNKLSNLDGPSVKYFSNTKDDLYYYNGKKLTEDEFKILSKMEKLKQL